MNEQITQPVPPENPKEKYKEAVELLTNDEGIDFKSLKKGNFPTIDDENSVAVYEKIRRDTLGKLVDNKKIYNGDGKLIEYHTRRVGGSAEYAHQLRLVPSSKREAVEELLKQGRDAQGEIGLPTSRKIDDKTTEKHYYEIVDTVGKLLNLLRQNK